MYQYIQKGHIIYKWGDSIYMHGSIVKAFGQIPGKGDKRDKTENWFKAINKWKKEQLEENLKEKNEEEKCSNKEKRILFELYDLGSDKEHTVV